MGEPMSDSLRSGVSGKSGHSDHAIRVLVESALREVASSKARSQPNSQREWVALLCEKLMSDSETSHHAVISQILAGGVSAEELHRTYIPAASRLLGELWVQDKASFVEVTVGAARLQALFRDRREAIGDRWTERLVPLGHSVLMVVPDFEQHTLGSFVAAGQMRRYGLWVHMGIGLDKAEIAELLEARHFSMLGVSAATWNSVVNTTEIVDYLRSNVKDLPPIVIGGRVATENETGREKVVRRTGADFAVRSAREAVERCGLARVDGGVPFDRVS